MNTYRVLPEHLRPYAEKKKKYFSREWGLAPSAARIEAEIHPLVDFRPTIHGHLADKHVLCAEICESLFTPEIERFLLSCRNHSIPAKLFVVVPKGVLPQVETKKLAFARENGIALLEISETGDGTLLQGPALSLSLTGLRTFRLSDFPLRYRDPLKSAIETFRQGNPPKGCAQVYDEIEALCRRIAIRASKISGGLKKTSSMNFQTEPWATLLDYLKANLDSKRLGCPELKSAVFNRLMGLTEYRNETGHKPNSLEKLIERDMQLRTRFESAVDELRGLVNASRPLRMH